MSEYCAEKELPPLPPASPRSARAARPAVSAKQVIAILDLLDRIDRDMFNSVHRVKENIKDTRRAVYDWRRQRAAHAREFAQKKEKERKETKGLDSDFWLGDYKAGEAPRGSVHVFDLKSYRAAATAQVDQSVFITLRPTALLYGPADAAHATVSVPEPRVGATTSSKTDRSTSGADAAASTCRLSARRRQAYGVPSSTKLRA
ncbi:hypothetical protein EWM64_g4756 [Hericium alpestre]|uniref:Uncharacterized protein n=1 Tax=Hericium alpestre TaxID=135208 RepID=A0A4Y9ZXE0_9AGAM|nr:hypothetical protein EWM64_g4756 [Hericium alpestre]